MPRVREVLGPEGQRSGLKLEAGFTGAIRDTVAAKVEERWTYIHHDVHAAGYALDPSNILVDVSENEEVWGGFMRILDRLCTKEEKKQALVEYAKYKNKEGLSDFLSLTDSATPLAFWKSYCGRFTVLKNKVALRILDLRAGTRCVESHFSIMGGIHSKGRARLVNGKVRKLTYIVSNTKMLDAAAKGDFTVEEKEDSDADDTDYATDTDQEDETALTNDDEEG